MNKIKVVSSIMGSGKSTYVKNQINKTFKDDPNTDKRFLLIVPYLKHIYDNVKDEEGSIIKETGIIIDCEYANFKQPKNIGSGKLEDLHKLIIDNQNIATTHMLFKYITKETFELLKLNEYAVIIDEVMQTTEQIEISKDDYQMLLENEKIKLNNYRELEWIDKDYEGQFKSLKHLCEEGLVIESFETERYITTKNNKKEKKPIQLLVWNFNPKIFEELKEVYILTYLFSGSYMYFYFTMHDIKYSKCTIQNNRLIKWEDRQNYNMDDIKQLINLYIGKLNNVGSNKRNTALSVSWFKNSSNNITIKQLQKNIYNYFRHVTQSENDDKIWTTYKSAYSKLKGKGYTNSFLQCAEKGSNEYRHIHNIAYCCNRYLHPDDKAYFESNNAIVNNDVWALSEMIQFIWRSAIRENEKINLFIPSERMRELFIQWLSGEIDVF